MRHAISSSAFTLAFFMVIKNVLTHFPSSLWRKDSRADIAALISFATCCVHSYGKQGDQIFIRDIFSSILGPPRTGQLMCNGTWLVSDEIQTSSSSRAPSGPAHPARYYFWHVYFPFIIHAGAHSEPFITLICFHPTIQHAPSWRTYRVKFHV